MTLATDTRSTSPHDAREQQRLAAVRRYHVLDSPPDGAFDRVAALAARLLEVPIALVSIVDEDRVWFKATHGLDGVRQVGREPGLCASVVSTEDVYVVPDALTDGRTREHPLVTGTFGLRFYAAAPIMTGDGYALGTINVIDTRPRQLTPRQAAVLPDLAAIVMDELELRLSALRVVDAERKLRTQAERDAARVGHTLAAFHQSAATGMRTTAAVAAEPRVCGLRGQQAGECAGDPVAKLVDLTGLSVWGCLDHAAAALAVTRGAFVASTDAPTLADFSPT